MPYPLSTHYPWVAKADTTHFQKDPAQKTTVKNFQVFHSSLCCIYNVDKAEVTELTGVIVMVTAEQFRLHCCWASPDEDTEWRLTGANMCVLTKSLILILFTSIFTNFKLQRGLPPKCYLQCGAHWHIINTLAEVVRWLTTCKLKIAWLDCRLNGWKYSQCNPMPPANLLTVPFFTTITND